VRGIMNERGKAFSAVQCIDAFGRMLALEHERECSRARRATLTSSLSGSRPGAAVGECRM
jgi:hypothetical protein